MRYFIPGQAQHTLIIKQSYLKEVNVELTGPLTRSSIQKKWVEKREFTWGLEQQKSFDYIKDAVSNNTIGRADPAIRYHLTTDVSK